MIRKPRLIDVAREAGVSLGTASNTLSMPSRVRPETREKVYAAMRRLGYAPKSFVFPADPPAVPRLPEKNGERPFLMTLGYISVDLIARIEVMPHRNDRITAQRITKHLGGPAANVAVAAAALGDRFALDVELATAIGTDSDSRWALESLARSGVRARAVRDPFRDRLSRCIVLLESDGSRTKVNEPLTITGQELVSELPADRARRPSHLHADGYQVDALLPAVGRLHGLGWHVSVHDTGLPARYCSPEGFATMVSRFDTVFINRRTAAGVLGRSLAADHLTSAMAAHLAEIDGRGDVVLTLGRDGAAVFVAGAAQPVRVQAPSVMVVDGTGAGDCFVGVYLALRLHGLDQAAAAARAATAGSLSMTAEGAQGRPVGARELDQSADEHTAAVP